MLSFELTGKVAVVTGATGHLGSDLSLALARAGARLVLIGRSGEALDALAARVAAGGSEARSVTCDLSVVADAELAAARAWHAYERVDIVVYNAVTGLEGGASLVDTPAEVWDATYSLIVRGCVALCSGLAPRMMGQGGGSIVTLGSSTGHTPTPGFAAYGLAKGGLMLLTKYMAQEWGPGNIRANCIVPGSIAWLGHEEGMTRLTRKRGILDRISMGRVGRHDEVVGALLYLASDASSFTSGQVVTVDGGRF
ncbi:SDR family NAD(P)-dependent oxidoreductase [Nocardia sp. CA-120079]|uniref:SDR family NAD(P)-dependent oxidoreductase n=1 Tax=Nocardia sp. CA-120079 TaxID=3239974 RepID=UPI003D9540AB